MKAASPRSRQGAAIRAGSGTALSATAGAIPRRTQRMSTLARVLAERGPLHLRDAAALLGVSEMTVRRDIATRADLIAYLGGHLLPAGGLVNGNVAQYALSDEEQSHTAAKIAICQRAAALIEDGDTVFIDCGSTTPHLAARIPQGIRATVICYSLNVANILCKNNDLRVILLGGLWHSSSASFSSEESLAQLGRLGINNAFISAAGVDLLRGASCVQFHEAPVKQAAMARSVQKVLLVDASKFGQVKPAFFARVDEFDQIITDDGVTPDVAGHKPLAGRLTVASAS